MYIKIQCVYFIDDQFDSCKESGIDVYKNENAETTL